VVEGDAEIVTSELAEPPALRVTLAEVTVTVSPCEETAYERDTGPLRPLKLVNVTFSISDPPIGMVTDGSLAEMVKSGRGVQDADGETA